MATPAPSPAQAFVDTDRLMEAMVAAAGTATLATLMTVNHRFYDLAAKPLYTGVSLDSHNFDKFMYDGEDREEPNKKVKPNVGVGEHHKGKGRKSKANSSKPTQQRTAKSTLLSHHLKAVTIGSHRDGPTSCHEIAKYLAERTQHHLELLIVQGPPDYFCKQTSCPFIERLKPSKIVLRKGAYLSLPSPLDWQNQQSDQEDILFLPTQYPDGMGFNVSMDYTAPIIIYGSDELQTDSREPLMRGMFLHFVNNHQLKIVFWREWYGPSPDPSYNSTLFVNDLLNLLQVGWKKRRFSGNPRFEFYGLERLRFDGLSQLALHNKFNGDYGIVKDIIAEDFPRSKVEVKPIEEYMVDPKQYEV